MCGALEFRQAENEEFDVAVERARASLVITRSRLRKSLRAFPGQVPDNEEELERREFEYVRRGTVNLLARLVVHSGAAAWGAIATPAHPPHLGQRAQSHGETDARLPSHPLPARPGAFHSG